jgi:hypothetical protein
MNSRRSPTIHDVINRAGILDSQPAGPTPAPKATLAHGLAKHIDPKCAGVVHAVFSLHDADELRGLFSEAGFSDIEVERNQRTLRLPGPQKFLWEYIHSTPLAALVGNASNAQREALQDEICPRWQEFVVDGDMHLEIGMTTVSAT